MKIVCDACSAKYSIADEKVRGKVFKIRCKKCSNIIVVRGSVSESAEPAPQYQKETKVFDYAGSGEGEGDAVWHLVIDQEQIGPMTVDEVRQRFERGEVDAESYVWREGFGDWERLADVDAFAQVVGGASAATGDEGALGNLFGGGGGAYDDPRDQNDPGDLFAARGAGDDGGLGGDLFAGPGLSSSGEDDGLFSASEGSAGGQAAAAPGKGVTSTLTAQRNENSVLFSLNNLAALASDSPRSSSSSSMATSSSSSTSMSASSSSSTSMPVTSASGPTEGSGLIDIRSMAQVYLGDQKAPSRPSGGGSIDDLPVFSQSSFEANSPVLLPNVQPAVNNRLLFALVGLIGVLVLAAAVLVIIVLKGGKDEPKVASIDEPTAAQATTPPASTAPAAGATAGTTPPAEAQPAAGQGGEPAATTPAGGEPTGAAGGVASAGTEVAAARPRSSDRDRDRDRDRKDRRDRDRGRSERDKPEPREKPVAAPPPDPTASSGCDEVTCLVEPDKPCCRNRARRSGGSSRSEPVDSSLPERPSRGDVASGIGNVKGSVSACGSRAPGGGKVTVKIKISPSGGVSSANASGGSASLNGCVESAVRRAKFPKSQAGASVNYPFIF